MVAVVSNESGLTLTFERPTEANVALALQPTIASKEEGSLKIVSSDVGESSIKEEVRKSEISMLGLTPTLSYYTSPPTNKILKVPALVPVRRPIRPHCFAKLF